jgi:hypothetical protein
MSENELSIAQALADTHLETLRRVVELLKVGTTTSAIMAEINGGLERARQIVKRVEGS